MFNFIKQKIIARKIINEINSAPPEKVESADMLTGKIMDDIVTIREKAGNSADLVVREVMIKDIAVNILTAESMTDSMSVNNMITRPLLTLQNKPYVTSEDIYKLLQTQSVFSADLNTVMDIKEIYSFIMSGFAVILIDGINAGVAIGVQGFQHRSVDEPSGEMNIRGSREGFVEPIRINMTLLRRRVKSPDLRFEMIKIGDLSNTDVCIAYISTAVSDKLLREVRNKLSKVKIDILLDSGYLQPFLETNSWNFFSDVGITERPDTLASKLSEGRIGIFVDGTPFVLVLPYLFIENFHSLDDYSHKPYYSTFVRGLKCIAFFITVLLPGLYVAVVSFHPEIIPYELLFNIISTETATHFPVVIEALAIHLIYEIMREAGLRLPKAIGHAVSIVGALVIGDAAVRSGIIAAPMIMVVALTALSAFVIPSLYESISVLKFIFIILGGALGLYGIVLGVLILLVQICALNNFGVPYFSPVSPFSYRANRDSFIRASWKTLGRDSIKLQKLKGADETINEG